MKESILAIIYKKENNKILYLLLKRIASRGGFYQPISGRCEEGETSLEAAKREIKEETGITEFKKIDQKIYDYVLEDKLSHQTIIGFEIDKDQKVRLDVNIHTEHDKIKWCEYNEAIKLIKWPNNQKALGILNNKLK